MQMKEPKRPTDCGHLNKYIRKSRNFSEKEIQYKRKLFCCAMARNGEVSAPYKKTKTKFDYLF